LLSSRVIQKNSRAQTPISLRAAEKFSPSNAICSIAIRSGAVRKVIDHFDRIDILINKRHHRVGPLDHMTREDYDRAMKLHFWAPYELVSQIGA